MRVAAAAGPAGGGEEEKGRRRRKRRRRSSSSSSSSSSSESSSGKLWGELGVAIPLHSLPILVWPGVVVPALTPQCCVFVAGLLDSKHCLFCLVVCYQCLPLLPAHYSPMVLADAQPISSIAAGSDSDSSNGRKRRRHKKKRRKYSKRSSGVLWLTIMRVGRAEVLAQGIFLQQHPIHGDSRSSML